MARPENKPVDDLSEAIAALCGVKDLLCGGPPNTTMHDVDPSNLFFLLDCIVMRLEHVFDRLSG